MEYKNSVYTHEHFMNFNASQEQLDYFKKSTYDILTPEGNSYKRNLELIAFNALNGNMLVKEKILYCNAKYEKVYIISKEGKAEKI